MFGRGSGKGLGFGVGGLGFKGWLQGLRGLELIGLRLIRLEPLALPFPGPIQCAGSAAYVVEAT